MASFVSLQRAILIALTTSLVGCAAGNVTETGTASQPLVSSMVKANGVVHGGQNPIAGAYIQLYAVGAGAYGAGAYPLIQTGTQADGSVQSIVSTNSAGNFTITGDYQCPSATTQVYITAVGGNPGLSNGTNNNSALIAALGNCGNLNSNTYIVINEVTTVAAVWALQGFSGYSATGATASLYWNGGSNNGSATTPATGFSVGAPASNAQGLANSFLVASNLANITTGGSPGNNTSGNISNVEYGTINLLGNVLASCVNSAGGTAGDSSNCGNLFADVTPTGVTAPQDTLQAAYLIARNPGNNVATIAGLSISSPPFNPAATTFNDFTIAYNIGGAVQTTYNTTFASPNWIAFDSFGNAWVYNMDIDGTGGSTGQTATSPYEPYLTELDPAGNPLTTVRQYYSSSNLFTIGNTSGSAFSNNHPGKLVVDTNNNVYADDPATGAIFAINGSTGAGVASTGVFATNAVQTGVSVAAGSANIQNMALDGQGYLWFVTGAAGAAPFATSGGYTQSLPTSSFSSNATPSGLTSVATGSNSYGFVIDNTSPTAANGAPYLWVGNTSNCTGNTTTGNPTLATTTAYGDIYPVATNTLGSQTKGNEAGFKAVTSSGVSTTSCSTTSYPTQLAQVNATFGGISYLAAPIAQPYALAVDSGNSLWIMNEFTAAAVSGSSAGQYSAVPELSVTHLTPNYGAAGTTVTFTNVAEGTGSALSTPVGGADTYSDFEIAVDGASNFWTTAPGVLAEFNYSGASNTVNPVSPTAGYKGSGSPNRSAASRKEIAIDRSGNIWSPNGSSNGNFITVIVGAATPVYTPLVPGHEGALP